MELDPAVQNLLDILQKKTPRSTYWYVNCVTLYCAWTSVKDLDMIIKFLAEGELYDQKMEYLPAIVNRANYRRLKRDFEEWT